MEEDHSTIKSEEVGSVGNSIQYNSLKHMCVHVITRAIIIRKQWREES